MNDVARDWALAEIERAKKIATDMQAINPAFAVKWEDYVQQNAPLILAVYDLIDAVRGAEKK
jgi:hypothetical protein